MRSAPLLNGSMDLTVAPALHHDADPPPSDATRGDSTRAEPLRIDRPSVQTAPVIFASPHSGRRYGADFVAASRLDPLSLRRSEDSFVDELFHAAPANGAPLLAATFPRAYCDVNREAWELDPAMFADALPAWVITTSARVSAGLGTIARVVASGEAIYREKLLFAEAERRITALWRPFHETLAALIDGTVSLYGYALLIDCHSMPSQAHPQRSGLKAPDFVLGDAHGSACSPRVTRLVERTLSDAGYVVRRNDPYAGGYITRHYGRPRAHVHALQIEISRELYMDETRIERLDGFDAVRHDITRLVETLVHEAPSLIGA